MIKKLVGLVLLVVVVAAAGFYWFVIRKPAPHKLTLDKATTTTVAGASSGSGGSTSPGSTSSGSTSVDGTWNVQASPSTTAGLRINEKFIGGIAEHTAVGRTADVTGSITISGTNVTTGSFTANLQSLEFTDSPPGLNVSSRKQALQQAGLQLSQFPTGSFKLSKPITLGSVPTAGKTITAKATGNLTLHGVTKSVSFSVQAEIIGGKIEVVSADPVPVKLSDYGMTPPTFGPVADVSKSGFFEFKLLFAKA